MSVGVPSRPNGEPAAICARTGVPDSLWRDAPNRGVGVMRVRNAARHAGIEL